MVTRSDSLWKTLDWVTIFIYLLLIVGGWFSVCGASYDYGERDFLDFSTRAGKQFVWDYLFLRTRIRAVDAGRPYV